VRRAAGFGVVIGVALVVTACGGTSTARKAGVGTADTTAGAKTVSWVDEPVSFPAGDVTVYATFRHPVGVASDVPAAVLIAGSGPTDRNGNSPLELGQVNTLATLAEWLSADGVASLRYDKLGAGRTGLGPYAAHVDSIGIVPYEQEALTALKFLAAQAGINDQRLAVIGHSEGALFALLLANTQAKTTPHIHAVGLLEPLSLRYLDVITRQVEAQVAAQLKAGKLTDPLAARVNHTLDDAVTQLRRTGSVPANLPYGLATVLNASTARFLYQADQHDPAALAATLPTHTPVFVTCSNTDLQVSCAEVEHLVEGLTKAHADIDFVTLTGVDHVLKVDPTGSSANYTAPLPFSPQLEASLRVFVDQNL
jgi:alpha-beta hydrolase superfamily lysophospholipase